MASASTRGSRSPLSTGALLILTGLVLVLVVSVLLARALGTVGVLLSVGLILVVVFVVLRRDSSREVESLRRSVSLSAADIATVLDEWHDFRHSSSPEYVRDRDMHRPSLLNPRSRIPSVARFHEAADACDRFLRHLPDHAESLNDVSSLTELLHETDQRAVGLHRMWERARRDAAVSRRH
ncbi:MAG: hypothetical protein ACTH1D_03990 [Mycobacteriaceae bacterium]|uniref:hypothetical protein n=1 Tax=Corynebacterium sp. TaxID=1720 RepID=UPI003F968EA3